MGATSGEEAPAEAARLRRLALEHQAAGRFAEAYDLLHRRLELAPRDAFAWGDMASLLLAARKGENALLAWDEALKLEPDHPELLAGKAGALQSLGRTAEARALYVRALERQADSFGAAFGLALLAVKAGDWDQAAGLAGPLEGRHGGEPAVAWMLARIALGRGELDEAARRAEGLAADPRLGTEQRADALLLQADALDRMGRAGPAFAAAAEAKGLQRRLFAQRAAGREGAVARRERLSGWFETADPGGWAGAPAGGEAGARGHAFIVGFPRSGTTLLEQALAGHPEVEALEEPPTLAAAAAEFLGSAEGLERLARLTEDEARTWREGYWEEVRKLGVDPAGRYVVDKAPAETVSLPLVAKLFPGARVLFAVRDPRDVVLSCFMSSFQMNTLTYAFTDLGETARCYGATMALAERYRGLLPLGIREVRHERLVEDFAAELAGVCGVLGIDFRPPMLDVAATARSRQVRTPSAPQVREGLTRSRLGRWRAYSEALEPVQPTLQPWIQRFGYPPE
jgi:tetratricopeptide (TPR) repeat protein